MGAKYEPTEGQIAEILAKYTPRQIAIAYLRAVKRNKVKGEILKNMEKWAADFEAQS